MSRSLKSTVLELGGDDAASPLEDAEVTDDVARNLAEGFAMRANYRTGNRG